MHMAAIMLVIGAGAKPQIDTVVTVCYDFRCQGWWWR